MAKEKKITYTKVEVVGKPRQSMFHPYEVVNPGGTIVIDSDQAEFFEAMGMAKILEENVPNPNEVAAKAAEAAKTVAKLEPAKV